MSKFLIVEDNDQLRDVLKKFICQMGHSTCEVDSEEDAIGYISRNGIECMFLDLELREGTGYGVLNFLHELGRFLPHVVMSGGIFNKPDWAEEHGFLSFEEKPFDISRIKELIKKANQMNEDFNRISLAPEKIEEHILIMDKGFKDLGLIGD